MNTRNPEHFIYTEIYQEKRQYCNRYTFKTKERNWVYRKLYNISTSDQYQRNKETRILFISRNYESEKKREQMIVLPQKNPHKNNKTETINYKTILSGWKNGPSRIQENTTINRRNSILEQNEKEYIAIHHKLSRMPTRKRSSKNRNRKKDQQTRRNLKKDVNRPHHKTAKNQRKEFDPSNTRSVLRNDSSENSDRKEKRVRRITELQRNSLKVIWLSKRNTNGQRTTFHKQEMEKTRKETRNCTCQDNDLSSPDKQSSRTH